MDMVFCTDKSNKLRMNRISNPMHGDFDCHDL